MPLSDAPGLQGGDLCFEAEEISCGSAHDGEGEGLGALAPHLEYSRVFLLKRKGSGFNGREWKKVFQKDLEKFQLKKKWRTRPALLRLIILNKASFTYKIKLSFENLNILNFSLKYLYKSKAKIVVQYK